MIPYLKGLHLTIDGWRVNRDAEGWRVASEVADSLLPGLEQPNAPTMVKAVPRFHNDLHALETLTAMECPPTVRIRPTATAATGFQFGDASGVGFGQSLWFLGHDDVDVFYGLWDNDAALNSSNWKEFNNQVLGIERGLENGTIPKGSELFLFTDNFVTERAYFHGTSKSRGLFELILRLHALEMKGELFIHLIWVAGTRMIEQGTDGISRGDLVSGVMSGRSMLDFIPISQGVYQRAPELVEWVASASGGDWRILEPKEWFHEVHLATGQYIWSPPPTIADAAVEQLCETRHTRPGSGHIFICPALMTSRWRKRLAKVADAMFTVPVGSHLWGAQMHEPVVIALICPLLHSRPWQVRDTPIVAQLRDNVSGVWSPDLSREWRGLREFWSSTKQWPDL
jgi:hypothetical protein